MLRHPDAHSRRMGHTAIGAELGVCRTMVCAPASAVAAMYVRHGPRWVVGGCPGVICGDYGRLLVGFLAGRREPPGRLYTVAIENTAEKKNIKE